MIHILGPSPTYCLILEPMKNRNIQKTCFYPFLVNVEWGSLWRCTKEYMPRARRFGCILENFPTNTVIKVNVIMCNGNYKCPSHSLASGIHGWASSLGYQNSNIIKGLNFDDNAFHSSKRYLLFLGFHMLKRVASWHFLLLKTFNVAIKS